MKIEAISPGQQEVTTGAARGCRQMVAAEQGRLRQQYEARLSELEAERQGAEADLAQVRLRQSSLGRDPAREHLGEWKALRKNPKVAVCSKPFYKARMTRICYR